MSIITSGAGRSFGAKPKAEKKRPCCVAIIVATAKGRHVLFIAPITSKAPEKGRIALEIPETEARRANLDAVIPLWAMVDEMNADILEVSHVLEDRVPRGQFTRAFTDMVITRVHEVRKAGTLSISGRT